jgi:hypothetical protein
MKSMKRLLIGTSLVAISFGISTPAFAAKLKMTDVKFNTDNINTWLYTNPDSPTMETVLGTSRKSLDDFRNGGNVTKAITALTDNDSATNVELWTAGETITSNVGFSGKLGEHTIRVESVTNSDWSTGTLAKSWLNGFLSAYDSFLMPEMKSAVSSNYNEMLTALQTKGLYSSGDPNVGDVTYDTDAKTLQVDLVGHLDRAGLYIDVRPEIVDNRRLVDGKPNPNRGKMMPNPTYLQAKNDARYATGSSTLDSVIAAIAASVVKQGKMFQMSEVAKVTFNDDVNYAFSFAATDSGAIAGDRNKTTDVTSHTGIYTWKKSVPTVTIQEVPEPSMVLGGLAAVGLAYRSRRKKSAE